MSNYRSLALSKAFVAAKEYLASAGEYYSRTKQEFICHALRDAQIGGRITKQARELATSVVMDRIYNHRTVQGWLYTNGYLPGDLPPRKTFNLCQEYRHRWLDALIEEFSYKPD